MGENAIVMARAPLVILGTVLVAGGTVAAQSTDGSMGNASAEGGGNESMDDGSTGTETMESREGDSIGRDAMDGESMDGGTSDEMATDESDMGTETQGSANDAMSDGTGGGTTGSGGQPGFVLAVALVALLAAGTLARRRRT